MLGDSGIFAGAKAVRRVWVRWFFGWFWVQGSGQVWGVVERLMTMTKGRIWGEQSGSRCRGV